MIRRLAIVAALVAVTASAQDQVTTYTITNRTDLLNPVANAIVGQVARPIRLTVYVVDTTNSPVSFVDTRVQASIVQDDGGTNGPTISVTTNDAAGGVVRFSFTPTLSGTARLTARYYDGQTNDLGEIASHNISISAAPPSVVVSNNISIGDTTVTNNVTIDASVSGNTFNVAAGDIQVATQEVAVSFSGATIQAGTVIGGATNLTLMGGIQGGITNGTLTLDTSTVALGTNAPASGSYIARSDNGIISWQPISGFWGSNLSAQVWSTPFGVTNVFTVSGTNDQFYTWTGGSTTILIKAWGGAGGAGSGTGGSGGFTMAVILVTNGMTFTLRVPYGGANNITQFMSGTTYSWPNGGTYTTNATSNRGSGGGCAVVLHGTNIVMLSGGGGGAAGGNTGGSGGWPNGVAGSGSAGGGTQFAGGSAGTAGNAGSYLQGANGLSTNAYQACGGCGIYGGGSIGSINSSAAGGASYLNPVYCLYGGYGVTGVNSGDPNYASSYGAGVAGAVGNNGAIIIITPTP